jgi:uncharacterized membrane protein YphA (DoxX/SURF4 family)
MTLSRDSGLRWLLLALRLILGAIFIYAAWTKLRESWLLFAMAIDAYGVLPQWGVTAVARGLPWLELGLGILLIAGFRLKISSTAVSLLLLTFFALMVRSYARGMEINCGCFGTGEAISPRTMLRDGALLAGSLFLTVMSFRKSRAPAFPELMSDSLRFR